jgi:hypothetical protein
MALWSYECVFEHRDNKRRRTKTGVPMTQTSECIVTDGSGKKALQYAMDELGKFDDYELVAIVRRNPIVQIIKEESKS